MDYALLWLGCVHAIVSPERNDNATLTQAKEHWRYRSLGSIPPSPLGPSMLCLVILQRSLTHIESLITEDVDGGAKSLPACTLEIIRDDGQCGQTAMR